MLFTKEPNIINGPCKLLDFLIKANQIFEFKVKLFMFLDLINYE